jgi:hypothetical protein
VLANDAPQAVLDDSKFGTFFDHPIVAGSVPPNTLQRVGILHPLTSIPNHPAGCTGVKPVRRLVVETRCGRYGRAVSTPLVQTGFGNHGAEEVLTI